MVLPAGELSQIRTDLETALPGTCYITSLTRTSDNQGGWTESWGTVGTSTCRLDFTGGKETLTGAALAPFTQAILTLPYDTTITEQNRVVFEDNTYTVQAVNIGSWLGVKRATLELIE